MDNFTLLNVPASRISKEGVSLAAVVEISDGDEDDEQDMKFDWERKRATQSDPKKAASLFTFLAISSPFHPILLLIYIDIRFI